MKYIAILLLSTTATYASECPSIENDLDRLACYDTASGLAEKTESLPPVGRWSVRKDKSEFKDTTDIYLSLESEEPILCRSYGAPQKVKLYLRCSENTTAMFVVADCHMASGHGGYGNVEYRIDTRKAKKRGFSASTDSKALGLFSGGEAIPMIKEMLGGEKMITRFTPYGENSVTATFNISGIDKAIEPLRKECGW